MKTFVLFKQIQSALLSIHDLAPGEVHSNIRDCEFISTVLFVISLFVPCLQLCCCPNSRCLRQWQPQPNIRAEVREMEVIIGVLMPPWEKKMFVNIHTDSNAPLSVVRDFVSLLQKNAPELNQEATKEWLQQNIITSLTVCLIQLCVLQAKLVLVSSQKTQLIVYWCCR